MFTCLFVCLPACLFVCLFVCVVIMLLLLCHLFFFQEIGLFLFLWVGILYYNFTIIWFFLETGISIYRLVLYINYFALSSVHLLVDICIIMYIFLHIGVLVIWKMFVISSFFICLHVDHDVTNASFYLCLFLYIIHSPVSVLKYWCFYYIFLLHF